MPFGPSGRLLSVCVLLAGVVAAHPFPTAAADVQVEAGAEVTYDSNVPRAVNADERLGDVFLDSHLGLSRQLLLGADVLGSIQAEFSGRGYQDYDALDRFTPALTAAVSRKFGVGPSAPRATLSLTAEHSFYDESIRDVDTVRPRIEVRKMLSDRLDLAANYAYETTNSRENATFDGDAHRLGTELGITLTDRTSLVLAYGFRRGDMIVHSDTWWYTDTPWVEVNTFGPEWYANRVETETHTVSLTFNILVSERASLFATYEHQESEATRPYKTTTRMVHRDATYPNDVVSVGFALGF